MGWSGMPVRSRWTGEELPFSLQCTIACGLRGASGYLVIEAAPIFPKHAVQPCFVGVALQCADDCSTRPPVTSEKNHDRKREASVARTSGETVYGWTHPPGDSDRSKSIFICGWVAWTRRRVSTPRWCLRTVSRQWRLTRRRLPGGRAGGGNMQRGLSHSTSLLAWRTGWP